MLLEGFTVSSPSGNRAVKFACKHSAFQVWPYVSGTLSSRGAAAAPEMDEDKGNMHIQGCQLQSDGWTECKTDCHHAVLTLTETPLLCPVQFIGGTKVFVFVFVLLVQG